MPYVYDTYAVLEYLSGNRRYARYFEEDYGFLTVLNLMEVYYAVLTRFGEEAAEEAYSAAATFLLEFGEEDVKEAMKLRFKLRRRGLNVSYADALGYHLSLKLKVKFLTGDIVFKGLENVEFVH
ncbi:type II toxin-antitoxin system VapC family toxin [Candidatus Bathyarchaeota archaeon]|nr:MAG: type II toxin-antitoxin system VapC family toxin [Candidatus Bathyarchaeota archaeon]